MSWGRVEEYRQLARAAHQLKLLNAEIQADREQLALCPVGHPDRKAILHNLGTQLGMGFNQRGGVRDLTEAVNLLQESLSLCPADDPDRYSTLNSLAAVLSNRATHTGDEDSLPDAIRFYREALKLCPVDHPDRGGILKNLATSLSVRYKRAGDAADVLEAIRMHEELLGIYPADDFNRGGVFNDLALNYSERYKRTSDINDLEKAIQLNWEALDIHWQGEPHSVTATNLAKCLLGRFRETGDEDDLTEAIKLLREALALRPTGHPLHSVTLNYLAECIFLQTECSNRLYKLVAKASISNRSSESVWEYYEETFDPGSPTDDSEPGSPADEHDPESPTDPGVADAINLGPRPLPESPTLVTTRGENAVAATAMEDDYDPGSPIYDSDTESLKVSYEIPFGMIRDAALHTPSPIPSRLEATTTWISFAQKYSHSSLLEAMMVALDLVDESTQQARSLESLYHRISEDRSIQQAQAFASDAAALAVEVGDVRLGATLVERGRAVIFTKLGRYRQVYDNVQEAAPDLALRFAELNSSLNNLLVHGMNVDSAENSMEDLGTRYYQASDEWQQTVDEIREIAGLESFLRPPTFEQLQHAAAAGPVVVLNINARHSDAIIILASDDPVLVPLPEVTPETARALADRLGERPAKCHQDDVIDILREVWRIIVEPVVSQLLADPTSLAKGSRIWWCPTGAASRLPLHAAGPYKLGERNLSNYFTSSYTPTLGALIRARQARPASAGAENPIKDVILVGQPETPNEKPLPKVVEEVQAIRRRAPNATVLDGPEGTREAVLRGLRGHKWIHFACHGHHNPAEPFQSSFSLYDGPVTLLDLIDKDLPAAELAVLSACHSARVSEVLPDEVLHPAAGMMFAGYKSVIGTMWALDDGLGSALADQFYRLMLNGKKGPKGYSDAAVVLSKAFIALDKAGYQIPFMQRINVVHYGA